MGELRLDSYKVQSVDFKPCPFCGSKDIQIQVITDKDEYGIGALEVKAVCHDCETSTITAIFPFDNHEFLAEWLAPAFEPLWNKRAEE